MRHRYYGKKFNRTSSHRRALFANLAKSLIEHEVIKTTLPKAKALRGYIEPLITLSKENVLAKQRAVYAKLQDKRLVKKLFDQLGPRFSTRPGGYTRVLKCGYRHGDNAPMAYIELVDSASGA